MQRWEYLVATVDWFGFNGNEPGIRSLNGQELKDWKRTPLHTLLTQLGADGWEMTGTISVMGTKSHNLFFKRSTP